MREHCKTLANALDLFDGSRAPTKLSGYSIQEDGGVWYRL